MPSNAGAEHTIHSHIGEIKAKDEPIVIDFELPSGEHKVLTFESYVTRADLKAAIRHGGALRVAPCGGRRCHWISPCAVRCVGVAWSGNREHYFSTFRCSTLAAMLGARSSESDDDLDAIFDSLDSDKSNSITRAEWQDFVVAQMQARMHTRAHTIICSHARAHTILCSHARAHTILCSHTCPCTPRCARNTMPHRTMPRHATPRHACMCAIHAFACVLLRAHVHVTAGLPTGQPCSHVRP